MSYAHFQNSANRPRRIPYSTPIMPRTAKRARSSRPARRAVGATKKRRSASVFKSKAGFKRKSYAKLGKRVSTRRGVGSSKARFAAKVASTLMGDRTVLYAFQDQIRIDGNTNTAATQIMWSSLQTQTQGGITVIGERLPGHIDDPQVLLECMQSGTAATAQSGAASTTSAVKAAYTKMLRKSWHSSYKLTNGQTSPCEVWEYRCQSRRDLVATVYPDSILGLAWAPTITAAVGSTTVATALPTGVLVSTTLGATPFMCNSFVRNFKILKVKKRIILPGKWWQISYGTRKPRMYSYKDTSDGDDNSATIAGRTMLKGQRFSLFVANGTAATFSTAGAGYQVGLSNVNLIVDQRVKVHYAMFGDAAQTCTGGVFQGCFSVTDTASIPLPQVQNQPLYAIGTVTTANGTVQPMITSSTATPLISGGADIPQVLPNAGPMV